MTERITRSIAAQWLGTALSAALSFLLLIFLARMLGPAAFGDYVALLSVASIVLIALDGGWATFLYRETAARREDVPLRGGATAHVLMATAAVVFLAAALGALALATALACMGFVAAMNLVSARLRGLGRFAQESLWQVSGRLLSGLVIIFVVIQVTASPQAVFLGWAFGLGWCLLAWGRRWLPRPSPALALAGYPLIWPFMVFEGLYAFVLKGDVVLLKLSSLGATEYPHYAVCTRFIEAAFLLFSPVTNVLLLHFRRAAPRAAFASPLLHKALAAAALAGSACYAGSLAWGEPLILFLFGSGFEEAGRLLPWVALMLIAALPNQVLFQALIAGARERWLAASLGVGAVVLVVGIWLGGSLAGARGAAVGVAAAQAILLICCVIGLRRGRSPVT